MGERFRRWFLGVVPALSRYRHSRRVLAGVLALGLLAAAMMAAVLAGPSKPHSGHGAVALSSPAAQPTPITTPAAPTSALPAPSGSAAAGSAYAATAPSHTGPSIVGRLLVSSIRINMPVEAVGTNARGEMGIPVNPDDAGWWQPGFAPGQTGHVVIDGHVNWYTGPGPFRDLHKLHQGDPVTLVWGDGRTYTFSVTSSTTYPWNASVPGAFGAAPQSTLVMITCAGTWDSAHQRYTQRLIVQAQLTSTA